MSKYIIQTALIASALLVSACSNLTPEMPEFDSNSVQRIGFFIDWVGHPVHSHTGTTIFNNNVKEYETDWDLRADFSSILAEELEAAGLATVSLEELGFTAESAAAVTLEKNEFVVNNQDALNKLREAKIDAVVTIRPTENVLVNMVCTQFGCSEERAKGHGLYSRSFLGISRFESVFAFHVYSAILQPPIVVTRTKPFQDLNRWQSITTKLESKPEDSKNLDSIVLDTVRTQLHDMFRLRAQRIAILLTGQEPVGPTSG